ncbi:MAG TPA: MBL fold metallo-hydrolase [Polyangiales bacterium]|nr:MBL fold metallo-hydrolase [Polyangiales bacterium]
MEPKSDLYFRQLAVGPMQNFVYVIGSQRTRECLVVDPAWDTQGLVEFTQNEGLKLVGALVTHYHPDHVGGRMSMFAVPGGIADLIALVDVPIHVNKHEADGLIKITGVSESDLERHDSGDKIELGDVAIELIHTPGHTPGSQCFLVRERLVTGDTLFVDGCGRVDLPGGDRIQLRDSLRMLAKLPDSVTVCPGHDYGRTPTNTMAEQKLSNWTFIEALP